MIVPALKPDVVRRPSSSGRSAREQSALLREDGSDYGTWHRDDAGLPCFEGEFSGSAAVERTFMHGFSTGRLNVLANRWGLIHLFTTEGGYTDLARSNGAARSGLYLEWVQEGDRYPLIHDDLSVRSSITYGVGYAAYTGSWQGELGQELTVEQEFYTPPDRSSRMGAEFCLRNTGTATLRGRLRLRGDLELTKVDGKYEKSVECGHGYTKLNNFTPELGSYILQSNSTFHGVNEPGVSLVLERDLILNPGDIFVFHAQVGYGDKLPPCPPAVESREAWAKRLQPVAFSGVERWCEEEAIWSMGQLYSFEAYDSSVNEHYLNLGGYGWPGFGCREVPETALTVAALDPELALSCLRWTAKVQYANGDIPHCHAFRRPDADEHYSTGRIESDNEIWFIIACAETAAVFGNSAFLDEEVPFWDGTSGTMWEHLCRAVRWVRDGIGVGSHGLIRIAEGDWNDYLSHVGSQGRGESMMNTGMACYGLEKLLPLAIERDLRFASECKAFLSALRSSAAAGFDEGWFVRGYTDEGVPFGTYAEDRLFLNAQSWCVLGKCGTPEMRETAMRSAIEKCHSPLGLTLLSRPYPCPPPSDISSCPIPAGEGENAGIWPQTVHWAIWAMVDLGWKEMALATWKRASLRNHAHLHPSTPFGIFNGPDCYSSHHSSDREGWTQVEMLERSKFPPMNPMVAWQAFSLGRILGEPGSKTANGR